MKLKNMIGSLTAKFAALVLTFGLAGGAWGATLTVGSSGADYTTFADAFAAATQAAETTTITLVTDITEDVTIPAGTPNCTINLDTFTIDGTIVNNSTGSYTLKTASASTEVHNDIVNNAGSLMLTSMIYMGSAINYGTELKFWQCSLNSAIVNRNGTLNLYTYVTYGANARIDNYGKINVTGATTFTGPVYNYGDCELTASGAATFSGDFVVEEGTVLNSTNNTNKVVFNGKVTNKGCFTIKGGPGSSYYAVFNEVENCSGATLSALYNTLFNSEPVNQGNVIIVQDPSITTQNKGVVSPVSAASWLGGQYKATTSAGSFKLNGATKQTYYKIEPNIEITESHVAKVGGVPYESLEGA